MKKNLFLILMLFIFTSCSIQKNSITSEKVNIYNVYGQKIIEVSTNNMQRGVYYIQVIDSEDSPYWIKKVVVEL